MTAVDTGWVSVDMIPAGILKEKFSYLTPLDEIDGARRVLDPVFMGIITGKPEFDCFI
jgi:hypothetical protein